MKHLLSIAISTLLSVLIPVKMQAVTIDASDYPVGTYISNIGTGATIQDVIHDDWEKTLIMPPTRKRQTNQGLAQPILI